MAGAGFIHGDDTDNLSLAGETIDYGPCAFMETDDPATVFSSIDQGGRYAYARQPEMAQWNLARLAECLLPFLAEDQDRAVEVATEVVNQFARWFEADWREEMARKLGLATEHPHDQRLVEDLLELMQGARADFTLSFRALAASVEGDADGFRRQLGEGTAVDQWLSRWRERLEREGAEPEAAAQRLRAANPGCIPRNHQVEQAISAAETGDSAPFEALLDAVTRPFDEDTAQGPFARPPEPGEEVAQTFCGT
ncbi:MAG: protein adenylyltransferase SelO family protein [Arhodomonas sp.]|nr:protein adenylyltransferase SelO family protein [Arhodomonas sp.]